MTAKIYRVTMFFIIFTIIVAIGYDIVAAVIGGMDSTISWFIWTESHNYPVISFALGFLCGHLVWSQVPDRAKS